MGLLIDGPTCDYSDDVLTQVCHQNCIRSGERIRGYLASLTVASRRSSLKWRHRRRCWR